MTQDRIWELLEKTHKEENEFNRNIGKIDAQIKELLKQKTKIAKRISNNMLGRNRLISMIKR